jgi:hypothetical protein
MMERAKFLAAMERAQAALEEIFPAEVVYAGQTYAAVGSGGRKKKPHEPGGFEEDFTRHLRISKAAMPAEPDVGKLMTVDGVQCRVASVSDRGWEIAWHVEVVPV